MAARSVVMVCFSMPLPPRHALMLRSLKNAGMRTTVLAWDRDGDTPIPEGLEDAVDRWVWIRLPAPVQSPRLLSRLRKLYKHARRELGEMGTPDLLVLTHMFLLPLAGFGGAKTVYDACELHDMQISFYFGRLSHAVRPFVARFETRLLRKVDAISTVDSKDCRIGERYRATGKPTAIFWNVPSKLDDPDPAEVEALEAEYAGRKVVAFVGGLKREKGLRTAIEAAAIVAKTHANALFLFIGNMKDDPAAVADLIDAKGVSANVRILDLMPYRRMMAHLRHASIGLAIYQPSWTYPFLSAGNGRKFFTYMQAGVPIVGPSEGEIGDSIDMARCGVRVDAESTEVVAAAVIELLDDPARAEELGANGRNAFEKSLNWERDEGRFLDFIDDVAPINGRTNE